jgi:glycosyltransferase involved in cell wall biosynthesis
VKKPDVALVMNVANGFWLPLLRARGIPTVVNVDGIEWDRAKWSKVAKAVFRAGAFLTARFANDIIVDSHEIARRWKTQFNRDGIFIPYGGDVPPALPLEPGLTHRGYVLVVARFVPENTIPEFIEAAAEIAHTWPVVIVGSSGYGGEIEQSLRDLTARTANIHWLGHVADDQRLLALWQHAGAYFHGHSVGGTNPALVQAMACGSPVVARDTVYNREVLGSHAVFVAPDPASISAGITLAMTDAAGSEKTATAASERAAEHYSWAAISQAYDDAITRLAT